MLYFPDGNAEEEEEMAPVMPKRGGDLDFDALLRQTQKMIKKKNKSSWQDKGDSELAVFPILNLINTMIILT